MGGDKASALKKLITTIISEEIKKLSESMSRFCEIYKATDGRWYLGLAPGEYQGYEDALWYGPFTSEDGAQRELENHSNPGSLNYDDSGTQKPPEKLERRRRFEESQTHKILPSRNLSIVANDAGSDQYAVEFDDNKKAESVKVYLNRKDIEELIATFRDVAHVDMTQFVDKHNQVRETTGAPPAGESVEPVKKVTETTDDGWTFTSKADIEFNIPNKQAIQLFGLEGLVDPANGFVSAYHQNVPVKWRLGFETREWGIKDMSPLVLDQDITFEVEYDDLKGETQQKQVTAKLYQPEIVIESSGEIQSSITFAIDYIDLQGIKDGKLDAEVHFRIA